MSLLERDTQLARMTGLVEAAGAGRGCVVILTGEAGAGKTTLARAIAESVTPRARVLWGACEDLSTPAPLGPLYDLARDCDWNLPLAISAAGSPVAVYSEALAQFDTPAQPTLVVIEDAHWADAASLDLIRYLGRRVRQTRFVLLITARTHEAASHRALGRALAEVPADDIQRLEAPPLSADAVTALATAAGRNGQDLFAATAGNAFFVVEALRSTEPSGPPVTVSEAVFARADRLSPAARTVLEAVSVFPRRAELDLARTVVGADVESGLEECSRAGLLDRDAAHISFRHEIARRAIEASLSHAARRDLNARVLDGMVRRGGFSATRCAHHATEAGDEGAIRAYAAQAAADASRVGAHREASQHFDAAIKHADGLPEAERIALYEKSAFEHHLIGRLDNAIAHQSAALALHRKNGDRLREGDNLRWLSRLNWLHGERSESERLAKEAVEVLEPLGPGRELAMAYSNMAQLAMLGSDDVAAQTWGDKAIALAEALDEPGILSHALNNVGAALQWTDTAVARAQLARSLSIALSINAQEHVARAYTNAACTEVDTRQHEAANAVLAAGISYCLERDLDAWRDYMRGWLALLQVREGRWREAAETAGLVLANPYVTPMLRSPATFALAQLRTRRGDPAVEPLLRDVAHLFERGVEIPRFVLFVVVRAEGAWLSGEVSSELLELLPQACEKAKVTRSEWLYGEAAFWAHKVAPGLVNIELDRVAAPYRLMLEGDWAGAAHALGEIGAPYERALALMEGDEAALREAEQIFTQLGAAPAAHLAQAKLLERGVRGPRTSTRENPAGLTRRQMEVLALIETGLSNAEISEKLFVAPKTVDHHVSAILAKLDVSSRAEAASKARRLGLLG